MKKSQSDLATQMGISVDTLQNYKMLADMIPEIDELVSTGIVTKTTTLAMMQSSPMLCSGCTPIKCHLKI